MFSRIKTTPLNQKTMSFERSAVMIIINQYILDVPTSIHIHIKAHSILLAHKSNKLYTWSLNSSFIFVYVVSDDDDDDDDDTSFVQEICLLSVSALAHSLIILRCVDEHIFFFILLTFLPWSIISCELCVFDLILWI